MRVSITSGVLCALLAWGAYCYIPRYWMYVPALLSQWRHPSLPNQPVDWKAMDATQQPRSKPNIVLILVDDLGFNDVSYFGGGYKDGNIQTPHIDSIGKDGVSFTNGYAGHATCAPSRASLLTGKFATKMGYEYTPINDWGSYVIGNYMGVGSLKGEYHGERKGGKSWGYDNMSLPFSEQTIPEALRGAGYRNIHLGKYHVGFNNASAIHRGFDETLGFSLISRYLPSNDPRAVNCYLDDTFDNFIWANTQYLVRKDGGRYFAPDGDYLTDYLAKEAVNAMKANQHNPFFLYLAFTSVHTPLTALKSDFDLVDAEFPSWSHCDKVYAAMIRALDRGVGTVMAGLEELGLSDDTIVIFTSDNGGPGYIDQRSINFPYRGWKGSFFEGGVRVPFFAKWPSRIPSGTKLDAVTSHIDIFPTILSAAGVGVDHVIDGVDLLPHIAVADLAAVEKPSDFIHDKLFWRSGDYKALRAGDWKIQTAEKPLKKWLYNLRLDPEERVNLADNTDHKERLENMLRLLDSENTLQADPLWPSLCETPMLIDKISTDLYTPGEDEYVYWAN